MKRQSGKAKKRPSEELREPIGSFVKEKGLQELGTQDLQKLLSGKRFRLDCGHRCTVGHNLANVMIIHSDGGGRITTECHACGY